MSGQPPNHPPAWSGGGLPPNVKKPPTKRQRPTRSQPNLGSKPKFIPPKDLASHLISSSPIPPNPLNRPKSKVKFGLRVEYGTISPYYNIEIATAITPITQYAGYVDIRPFKGYLDLGFQTSADADHAASIPVSYKGKPILTTRTQNPASSALNLRLVGLPTHLKFETLHREIMTGLYKYGLNPLLLFDTPVGFSNIAGPTASATIELMPHFNPSSVPPLATLPSSPDTPFKVLFEQAQKACILCGTIGHYKGKCTNHHNQGITTPGESPVFPTWGSTIVAPAKPPSDDSHTHQGSAQITTYDSHSAPEAPNRSTLDSTTPLSLLNQAQANNPPRQPISSNSHDQVNNLHCQMASHLSNQNKTATTPIIHTCELPPPTQTIGDPFTILELYQIQENGEMTQNIQLGPTQWFEETIPPITTYFRPKNRLQVYLNHHNLVSKIKQKNLPSNHLSALMQHNKAIKDNLSLLAIPDNTPQNLMDALDSATQFAKECLQEVVTITDEAIASQTDPHQHRSVTKLMNSRVNANEALANLAQTLYSYDSLSDGSTIMSLLTPHIADIPTPWLCAFERLPLRGGIEPEPPDAMVSMD